MTRTPTVRLDDERMWRTVLARLHPDAGGSHEAFIFGQAVRDEVCTGAPKEGPEPSAWSRPYKPATEEPDRLPYDPALGYIDEFCTLTLRALSVGQRVKEPYRQVLTLLADCPASEHGRRGARRCRGASYRQLARIGHSLGWSKAQRARFYELCRSIPLSEAHASHIISRLGQSGRGAA